MTDPRPLAVVTGASSGIGRELAVQFAENGFDLIVAAEDERVDSAARSFAEHDIQAIPVRADLATFNGVEDLYRAIQATGRIPEALAINAGVGVGGDFARDNDLGRHGGLPAHQPGSAGGIGALLRLRGCRVTRKRKESPA